MGTLKPGATYIYERVDGTVYAREFGKTERQVVGYNYVGCEGPDPYYSSIAENYFLEVEWKNIIKAAKDNPALQEAIERVKIIYHLSKEDGKE